MPIAQPSVAVEADSDVVFQHHLDDVRHLFILLGDVQFQSVTETNVMFSSRDNTIEVRLPVSSPSWTNASAEGADGAVPLQRWIDQLVLSMECNPLDEFNRARVFQALAEFCVAERRTKLVTFRIHCFELDSMHAKVFKLPMSSPQPAADDAPDRGQHSFMIVVPERRKGPVQGKIVDL